MKAVVYHRYGSTDVLALDEISRPRPAPDEVLVRIRAASVNPYDWHFMTGKPFLHRLVSGIRTPKRHRLGADLAGVVEDVGRDVTGFRPGDEVFGEVNGESPGHPTLELASFSEYAAVAQRWLAHKPAHITFEQAAAVPLAATTALQGLRDYGNVQPGDKVLINGASGGVGTFAVQIAKAYGAEVTGVCSTRNAALVRELGADHVIDYTTNDFTRAGERYDLLLDNVGNRTLAECRRVLAPQGMYLASFGRADKSWLGPLATIAWMRILTRFVGHDLLMLEQHRDPRDIQTLRELIEAGKLVPVVDRTYPLSDAAEAMKHLETGHARGKIVITM